MTGERWCYVCHILWWHMVLGKSSVPRKFMIIHVFKYSSRMQERCLENARRINGKDIYFLKKHTFFIKNKCLENMSQPKIDIKGNYELDVLFSIIISVYYFKLIKLPFLYLSFIVTLVFHDSCHQPVLLRCGISYKAEVPIRANQSA